MRRIKFNKVVPNCDTLMGVKAVWGRSSESIMCFGSRGDPEKNDKSHFSMARTTAERALGQPYFITIGGGKQVPDKLRGRILELVRGTGVYGETKVFVQDEAMQLRLAQWPVAIIISEVYSFCDEPYLVEDLGFPDKKILENAYDSVIRNDENIENLWDALKDREIERRWDVTPPPGFRDPGKVQLCGSQYPKLDIRMLEGKKVWKLSLQIERDSRLKKQAKNQNRELNNGVLVCAACGFSDELDAVFDAHHLQPLSAGRRESRIDDLVILCPTCHRWAHAKAKDKLSPLSIETVRIALGKT